MLFRLNIMAAIGRVASSMSRLCVTLAAAGLLAFVVAAPARAQAVERLGDFGDWSAFQFTENNGKACYMASQPQKAEGDYTKRGEAFVLVTHRPKENRRDEVSIIAGYTFKKDSMVEVSIGGTAFELFTADDGAWTVNKNEDKRLVNAMIRGATMLVKGTSSRGTPTSDTYSLSGFTKAYKTINKACGL